MAVKVAARAAAVNHRIGAPRGDRIRGSASPLPLDREEESGHRPPATALPNLRPGPGPSRLRAVSLYGVQKLIYQLNRDPHARERYEADFDGLLRGYALTAEEERAVREPDVGLLYVLGVNGQLLMHYAALRGYPWDDYIEAMREGVRRYGPVRAGIYALAGGGAG